MKLTRYIGIACLAYLLLLIFVASDRPEPTRGLKPTQEIEAQDLASRASVERNGRVIPLGQKDAEMIVETCSMLQDVKISDMTPKMLSVWDICRSHRVGR